MLGAKTQSLNLQGSLHQLAPMRAVSTAPSDRSCLPLSPMPSQSEEFSQLPPLSCFHDALIKDHAHDIPMGGQTSPSFCLIPVPDT